MSSELQYAIRLRAPGKKPGTTKEWIGEAYQDFYVIRWGTTGTKGQSRKVNSNNPMRDVTSKALDKQVKGKYVVVSEKVFPQKDSHAVAEAPEVDQESPKAANQKLADPLSVISNWNPGKPVEDDQVADWFQL